MKSSGNSLKNAALNFELSNEDNDYETIVSLDNQIQKKNQNLNINLASTQNNYYDYSLMGDASQYYYNQNIITPTGLAEESQLNKICPSANNQEISKLFYFTISL